MAIAGKFWRFLVGIKDALVLIFMLLFFSLLFLALSSTPSPATVREGALYIELNGFVVEERSAIPPLTALANQGDVPTQHEARTIVRALDAAASDDRIKAVVMDLSTFIGGGQVHMQEIAEAMDRVRKTEKPVLTYALGYGDDHMHLASHASEVWADPMGGAMIAGPGGSFLFYGELLDRLNVNARVYRVGEFKSAVEPYLLNSMSAQSRENIESLYGALWEEWKANVKKARPDAQIDTVLKDPVGWIESATGDMAQASLAAGLVDTLGDRVQFGKRVAEIVGEAPWEEEPGAYAKTDLDAFLADHPEPRTGRTIAVVRVAGEIVDGNAGPGTAGGSRIAGLLNDALNDDVAGLVVRVNSPGGSVLASETIRRAIDRYRERDIPVAISFANVAASGGYWVATAGDRIFAQPETVTGSIGVFAVLPTFEGTARDYGVSVDAVRTTPLSGQPDVIGGFTPEVDTILQAGVEDTYNDFLTIVSNARGMPMDEIDRIAQGRVWDGGTARQIKLVDQFGGMPEALAWVAGEAGLEDGGWHARYLKTPEDSTQALLRQFLTSAAAPAQAPVAGDLFATAAQSRSRALAQIIADAERLTGRAGVQAYCLECPAAARPVAAAQAERRALSSWSLLRAILGS